MPLRIRTDIVLKYAGLVLRLRGNVPLILDIIVDCVIVVEYVAW